MFTAAIFYQGKLSSMHSTGIIHAGACEVCIMDASYNPAVHWHELYICTAQTVNVLVLWHSYSTHTQHTNAHTHAHKQLPPPELADMPATKSRLRVRKHQVIDDASGCDFIQAAQVGDQEIRYWTVDLNRCQRVCKPSSKCDYFIGNLEGHWIQSTGFIRHFSFTEGTNICVYWECSANRRWCQNQCCNIQGYNYHAVTSSQSSELFNYASYSSIFPI